MILFVCDRNASLSPMAEAIAANYAPHLNIQSAGAQASHVRSEVVQVLTEERIFSNGLTSKSIHAVDWEDVKEVVVLVPKSQSPQIPSRYEVRYWGLPDPQWAPFEERMEAMRDLRDELIRRITALYSQMGLV